MNHSKGFSLIELVVVVGIVGILSTIAYGLYIDQVIASNRTEARAALQQAAGTLEKCKSLYGSYNNLNCNYADFTTESNYYDIAANGTITGSAFTLTATPAAGSRQLADTECTSLTLTNTGVKGGTPDPNDCW